MGRSKKKKIVRELSHWRGEEDDDKINNKSGNKDASINKALRSTDRKLVLDSAAPHLLFLSCQNTFYVSVIMDKFFEI